jgi:hypothetical protein
MSNSSANSPFESNICPDPTAGSGTTENALKMSRLGVGMGEPLSAVCSATEQPNNSFSGHSFDTANLKRQELIYAGSELKQDWLHQDHWKMLAASRSYRLPHWYLPLSPKGIEKVLRDLGLNQRHFRECFGRISYKQFASMNPKMPLWAFAGQCLEQIS